MQSKEDVLNREPFVKQIVDLTKILSEKRKNCCFAIEGEWGSGKSFVLEKIQECLQVEQSETTNTDRFFVVRYDCWRYDYYEEPIVAIISVLKDQIEQYVSLLSNETKVDTSGYPDVETRIGKDYFDSIRDYAKHIRQYPKKVNYKFVCKENDFVDKMIL